MSHRGTSFCKKETILHNCSPWDQDSRRPRRCLSPLRENSSCLRSKGQLAVSWAGVTLLWSRWRRASSYSHVSQRRTTPFASAFLPTHLLLPWRAAEETRLAHRSSSSGSCHRVTDGCSSCSRPHECRRVSPAPRRLGNCN